MAEEERLVRFELLGQEHAFYTAAPEREIESILSLVRSLVETDAPQSSATLPVSKVAILACLNIASRYVQLEQEFVEYKDDANLRIARLNNEIKARLHGE